MKTLNGQPNYYLAILLNLTEEEVDALIYTGLHDIKNEQNETIGFYIQISTNNHPALLAKLRLERGNLIYFRFAQVQSVLADAVNYLTQLATRSND
ncbi:hypothetical protein [Pedobacter jeongneungensis]|uniref:hypothetical protein n=1 Tax=Pedobacter jeongneungensis TaxID=947309 RepID=UPI00046A7567|nr:hypothetical protein [Pedobacter jeongneungensis]